MRVKLPWGHGPKLVFVLAVLVAGVSVSSSASVNFPDGGLEAAIREATHVYGRLIEEADLLEVEYFDASYRSISDLEGIQYCVNLVELDLWNNQIVDISPLSRLDNLVNLNLWTNQIDDISALSGLDNLETLGLGGNQIVVIPDLSKLTNLGYLDLPYNQIVDISPLSSLTNLSWLILGYNQIVVIPDLSKLTKLSHLGLASNQIADISPLSSLTNLVGLGLDGNQIVDISALVDAAGLGALNELYIRHNCLQVTLGSDDRQDIQTLIDRGVNVLFEPQNAFCSAVGGDISGDGVVDLLDVRLCLQIACGILAGTPEQRQAADVDGDGDVDLNDAEILSEYAIGIRPTLP